MSSICAQCGSPAEDGFAHQYCTNRECSCYPTATTGEPGRKAFRAVRISPTSAIPCEVDITYPNGVVVPVVVYDSATYNCRTRDASPFWRADSPSHVWNASNPKYRAVMDAVRHGRGEAYVDE